MTLNNARIATSAYRPDLYRAVAAPLGLCVPRHDSKPEGAHAAPWQLEAAPAPIAMGPGFTWFPLTASIDYSLDQVKKANAHQASD